MYSPQKMSFSQGLCAFVVAIASAIATNGFAENSAPNNVGVRNDVQETRNAVIAKVKSMTTWDASELWMVQMVARHLKDAELQRLVEERAKYLDPHPMLRLLDASRPATPLPSTPGKGFERLMNLSVAPFGVPHDRAVAWSTEIVLATDYEGPLQSLQLLTIIYCEQLGLQLPDQVRGRRLEIANKMREELAKETAFSYMLLQRLAILSAFETIPDDLKERSLKSLLAAQKAPGDWGCPAPPPLTFDGDTLTPDCSEKNILVLALVALTFA